MKSTNIGYKQKDPSDFAVAKAMRRIEQIFRDLEIRIKKLEDA